MAERRLSRDVLSNQDLDQIAVVFSKETGMDREKKGTGTQRPDTYVFIPIEQHLGFFLESASQPPDPQSTDRSIT
jgi:hypothetical protein